MTGTPPPPPAPYVAVVGPGRADEPALGAAHIVGSELARAGAVLVCGGLGGVMEAACRGAHDAGGTTVGLLPGPDRAAANRWVGVAIATGLGELRNGLVVRAADGVIAVGRGFGTLSEIALALRLGRPVVGVDSWDIGAPAESVHDPADAVARVLELVTKL